MGYEINWNTGLANQALFNHPLYIKYSSTTFGNIDTEAVKNDLAGVMATADSAEVMAYLAWLLRSTSLLVG